MPGGRRRRAFWFELDDDQRTDLLRCGRVHRFPAQTAIIQENDPSNFVLILRDGCVKISSRSEDGYETVLGLRNPGDLVGEMSSLDHAPRSATVLSLIPVEALVIPGLRFLAFLNTHPRAVAAVQRSLSARLREADRYRRSTASRPLPRRFAALLIDLGMHYGSVDEDGSIVISLPLSQDDLAGLLLTSRRTIGRVLERWREQGLVVTGRRNLVLKQPDVLDKLAS